MNVSFLVSAILITLLRYSFNIDYETYPPHVPMKTDSLALAFSTYIGGSTFEQIRDITCDKEGNIYITGGTQSWNFPTTNGAYQRVFKTGGTSSGSGGPMDIFVVKYAPDGQMLWSTLLGGPNYDRAYAMEVDDSGYVYLGGRAGEGFPTTQGTAQPVFGGDTSGLGAYGKQDGFVAKISPDGSRLIWATYFGRQDGGIIRDIDIDKKGNIYLVQPGVRGPHPHVTSGAYQTKYGGSNDVVVAKLSSDASTVMWATYYGGSGDDGGGPSVRVDPTGAAIVVGSTTSLDLPVSTTAFDTSYNGGTNDLFVAKFSADGSSLVYGTYLGGNGNEGVETHNLGVDGQGNAYISSGTSSTNFPTTPGAFQRAFGGGGGDVFITKLSTDGRVLLGSTFVGGSLGDFPQGVYIDPSYNIIVGGNTQSLNFPVTATAFQTSNAGSGDFFVFKLAADFSAPLYSTYLGGTLADDGRTLWGDTKGNIYVAGQTLSRNWPLKNAAQPAYADTASRDDGCLARFSPPAATTGVGTHLFDGFFDLQLFPSPSMDHATLSVTIGKPSSISITLVNLLGQMIHTEQLYLSQPGRHVRVFSLAGLSPGLYTCIVRTEEGMKGHSFVVAKK